MSKRDDIIETNCNVQRAFRKSVFQKQYSKYIISLDIADENGVFGNTEVRIFGQFSNVHSLYLLCACAIQTESFKNVHFEHHIWTDRNVFFTF